MSKADDELIETFQEILKNSPWYPMYNAAPKLLEALKEAVRMYGHEGGPWNVPEHPGSWISQARAAIAEAEPQ